MMYYVIYDWIAEDWYIVDELDIILADLGVFEEIVFGPASYADCEDYLDTF